MDLHDLILLFTLFTSYRIITVESTVPKPVLEWQHLAIKWHYDYPDDWERAVTYWRFFNETIEQAQAVILMLKDGSNPAQMAPAYEGKVEELDDYNGGILVKDIRWYQSGTYLIQMDFKDRVSYNNRTDVTVIKYSGRYDNFKFSINSNILNSSAEYILTEEEPVNIGVNATDLMPPGTITLTYCVWERVCEEATSCFLRISPCKGNQTLQAAIDYDRLNVTTMEMTLVSGVDNTVPILIFEGQQLTIKWLCDFSHDWDLDVTVVSYFNDTIEEAQAIPLMVKDGNNTAQIMPSYAEKVEVLEDCTGAILVKDIRIYESGTYLIQMNFTDRITYINQTEVNVLKYIDIHNKYEFFIGNKTFFTFDKYILTNEEYVVVGLNATEMMPSGTITLSYCNQTRMCEEATSCSYNVTLCIGKLTVLIEYDGLDATTLEMTIVSDATPRSRSGSDGLYIGIGCGVAAFVVCSGGLVIVYVKKKIIQGDQRYL